MWRRICRSADLRFCGDTVRNHPVIASTTRRRAASCWARL
jgi:hypothetical protein